MDMGQLRRAAGTIALGGVVVGGTLALLHTVTKGVSADETAASYVKRHDADTSGSIDIATESTFSTWIECARFGRTFNERTTIDAGQLFGKLAGADGVLGQSELAAHMQSNWDTNGNGLISLSEQRDGEYADGITSSNNCDRA